MQRVIDILVGAAVAGALVVLFSCSQTDTPAPIPAPTVTQPAVAATAKPDASAPVVVPQVAVTHKSLAGSALKAKRSAGHGASAERAAYEKAYRNAALANKLLGEHRYNIPANFAHIALQQT